MPLVVRTSGRMPAALPLMLVALVCSTATARQIRINRYETQVVEDDAVTVQARVREIKPTPYPAAGYRPGRAFLLPGEAVKTETSTQLALNEYATTFTGTATELPGELSAAAGTTTTAYEVASSTLYNDVPAEVNNNAESVNSASLAKTPYPAAGYRPYRAFNLPTENQVKQQDEKQELQPEQPEQQPEQQPQQQPQQPQQPSVPSTDVPATDVATTTVDISDATATEVPLAPFTTAQPSAAARTPYPAAGYRPSRAFNLPTEVESSGGSSQRLKQANNTNHPACGSNDNPVAPKPPAGAKDDPDAERVLVPAAIGPAVVRAPIPASLPLRVRPLYQVRSQALMSQPLIVATVRRPNYAYAAQPQRW